MARNLKGSKPMPSQSAAPSRQPDLRSGHGMCERAGASSMLRQPRPQDLNEPHGLGPSSSRYPAYL